MSKQTFQRILTRRKLIAVLALTLVILLFIEVYSLSRNSRLSASAVVTSAETGVYWNYGATNKVTSINWGNMTPASTKNIRIYIRNESNESRILTISDANWNTFAARTQLRFSYKSTLTKLPPGAIANVTITLNVPATVSGIEKFSFDIIIISSSGLPWDVNEDGRVDTRDVTLVTLAFTSTAESPSWDPRADVNSDGIVNFRDLAELLTHFGETA